MSAEIQIPAPQMMRIDKLDRAAWNANVVPPDILEKITASIVEFGIVENLVARKHPDRRGRFEVLSGNHRLDLYRELGVTDAPVTIVNVDDAHARILAQTLNRTRGADDPAAYAALLTAVLADVDLDEILRFLPETEESVTRIIDGLPDAAGIAGGDDAPPLPPVAESKEGEVYELGPHRLVCGDARDPAVLVLLMDGVHADMIWTDPPYGVDYVGKTADELRIKNDDLEGLEELLGQVFDACDHVTNSGAAIYAAHAVGLAGLATWAAFRTCEWSTRQVLIWAKDQFVMGHSDYHYAHEPILFGYKAPASGRRGRGGTGWFGGNNATSVFNVPRPCASTDHPTMKPVDLIRPMIENSSRIGGVVLDPFGGSGSTLIAAHQSGRVARLVEIDPRYCDVIRRRYEELEAARP